MWQFGLAFLVLVAGGVTLVLLSYPILITLERPVRITPEQAVRDFYSAVSHHLPHYRRMWLLLSDEGRISGSFASLEGFQSYWKQRIEHMRAAGRASGFTPLKFHVDEFRSERSAGKSEVDASYSVIVSVRGRGRRKDRSRPMRSRVDDARERSGQYVVSRPRDAAADKRRILAKFPVTSRPLATSGRGMPCT